MLELAVIHPDGPGDVSGLNDWLGRLPREGVEKLAILGKTEGPATLNDFSRDLAQAATDAAITEARPDLMTRAFRLFSTGCEGVASPVALMLASVRDGRTGDAQGLAIGVARSEAVPPDQRGSRAHVEVAADTVSHAIIDAGLSADQVALVLVKSPVRMPGAAPTNRHTGSTGSSRGAAAMGAGLALGEISSAQLSDDPVLRDAVHASRVMAFSGTETDRLEVLVLGERPGGDPRWGIVTQPTEDLLDRDGFAKVAAAAPSPELVLFKAGIAPDGRLRGRRTTVLTSELPADKQLRAAASGVIAAHFGATAAFISGGAEHQAAPGGCLCSAIVRRG